MKKMFKALLGLYTLIFLSVFIQGCCEINYQITSEGRMSAYEFFDDVPVNESIGNEIDTIKGMFILSAGFNSQVVAANSFSFINSAYAFSCAENQINELDEESVTLTVNKPNPSF